MTHGSSVFEWNSFDPSTPRDYFPSAKRLLRSTKEERFLISWATCDRVGFLCTQAKADPCFFVRSVGRPGVHLFSAILNDVTISLRKGCCLVNDVTISLRKGCCLVLCSLSDVRERGCSLVNKLYCPFIAV